MDIRELANDPEFSKKMGAALAKHQETMADAAKATEEAGQNWEQSMTALNELQQERGMSDEERIALIKKLFGEIDPETKEIIEPGIIGNAAMGSMSTSLTKSVTSRHQVCQVSAQAVQEVV